ncbi:hypothetical protein ACWC0C_38390 [Streptomyces sp. NPDC001709]
MRINLESDGLLVRVTVEEVPGDDETVRVNFDVEEYPGDEEAVLAEVEFGRAKARHTYDTRVGTYTIRATGTATHTAVATSFTVHGQLGLTVKVGSGPNWNKSGATVTGLREGATASVNFDTEAEDGEPVTTPAAGSDGTATIPDNTFTYPEEPGTYDAVATATGYCHGADTVTIGS